MPVLLLIRDRILSDSEIARLPMGCFPTSESSSAFLQYRIVAKAELRAPPAILLKTAFAMGVAIPDAQFGYEEGFQEPTALEAAEAIHDSDREEQEEIQDAEEIEEKEDSESSEESADASLSESVTEYSWQELLEQEKSEEAMDAIGAVLPLSQHDHVALLKFFASNVAHHMIFVCDASIRFKWKTMVLKLRMGLRHPDADVRCAILKAIGLLAGPALSPSVQLLLSDPEESVRKEAAKALRRLKKR